MANTKRYEEKKRKEVKRWQNEAKATKTERQVWKIVNRKRKRKKREFKWKIEINTLRSYW